MWQVTLRGVAADISREMTKFFEIPVELRLALVPLRKYTNSLVWELEQTQNLSQNGLRHI